MRRKTINQNILYQHNFFQVLSLTRSDRVNWPVTVTWKTLLRTPYIGETAVHWYLPSCKLFSTTLVDNWLVKPSLANVKPPANMSTVLPFTVHITDVTGGLASMSHRMTSVASSSTATSSDPESIGASEQEKCDECLLIVGLERPTHWHPLSINLKTLYYLALLSWPICYILFSLQRLTCDVQDDWGFNCGISSQMAGESCTIVFKDHWCDTHTAFSLLIFLHQTDHSTIP